MEIKKKVNRHIKHWRTQFRHFVHAVGKARLLRTATIFAIVLALFIPIIQEVETQKAYALDPTVFKMVGATNNNLVKKFSYDASRNVWQFNKDGTGPQAAAKNLPVQVVTQLKAQLGGESSKSDSLYSVDLNADASQGSTYYDNNTGLSFSLVPKFKTRDGREQQGKIVYPFAGGKVVYSPKGNGLKEDIVLTENIGDEVSYTYDLKLPVDLEAHIMDDGALGVYSADLALYSASSSEISSDPAKLESARKSAPKDHLMFALPAPTIVQANGKPAQAAARLIYKNNVLTVQARGLSKLSYPLSIDPTVVVTSSSDFAINGNNESNIEFPTNQLNRGAITGGTMSGAWSSPAAYGHQSTGGYAGGAAIYNGYLYIIGPGNQTFVQYAPLNATTGAIGAYTDTSQLNFATSYSKTIAYNGYLYYMGGYLSGATSDDSVQYAQINSNGTLGAWVTSSNHMVTGVCRHSAAVYNGFMYITGGNNVVSGTCLNASTPVNTVQYAPILGNGDIGTWSTTTTFATARMSHESAAYNGYLYVIDGTTNGSIQPKDVQYVRINDDGTVGTWVTVPFNVPVAAGSYRFGFVIYGGYMYEIGGGGGVYSAETYFARINANGSIGPWQQTTAMPSARWGSFSMVYNGFLYSASGTTSVSPIYDTIYNKIDPAGSISSDTTVTSATTATVLACSTTYNNFIYNIGGAVAGTAVTNTYYGALNTTSGAITSWTGTTALNIAASNAGCVTYGGRIYVVGGVNAAGTTINSIQYVTPNTAGTLPAWTTNATNLPNAISGHAAAAYEGYLYIIGTGTGTSTTISYAAINANGSISNTWNTSTFGTARVNEAMVAYGGNLYIIGGDNGAGTANSNVQYSVIGAAGAPGTWNSTTSMNTARTRIKATVINGYVYVLGGENGAGTAQSTMEFAPVNSAGTLGTWVTNGVNLSVTRARYGLATYGDKMYLIAGNTSGTAATTSHIVSSNTGGWGLTDSWTTNPVDLTGPFPNGWAYGRMTAYNGFMYAVGGYYLGPTYYTTTYYAPINTDGSLGSWTATSALHIARYSMSLIAYNDYIYAIAGHGTGSTFLGDYEYAQISPSGGLASSWTQVTTGQLATARSDSASVVYNGYVYIMGGLATGSSNLNDVNYAQINANGTLGSWTISGTSFTTGRRSTRGFAYNGYLYVLGGQDSTPTYFNDVQYIALNGNGSLNGSWKTTSPMPTTRSLFEIGVANGYVYVYGGTNITSGQNSVMTAEITANGSIDNWQQVGTFTTARNSSGYAFNNGFLYLAGGYSSAGSTYFTDVQYTRVKVTDKKGIYTKLIDLGGLGYLSSIAYNGNLPDGLKVISYRTAGSNGLFGASKLADNIAAPVSTCGSATVRYLFLTVTLYDGGTYAVMPDSASNNANLTDMTIYYVGAHPTPDKRLYGGKYFEQEIQQPLDTCGP